MTLPRQNSAWVDGDGRPTRDLYNWARQITVQPQTGVASSYSLGDLTNVSLSGISDGDVLTWSNTQSKWINSAPSGSSGGYSEGTSFPGSPTTGQKFYRTDLNFLCFYDGTRWLTAHEYALDLTVQNTAVTATGIPSRASANPQYRMYLTYAASTIRLTGATNDGSNYWTIKLQSVDTTGTETAIVSRDTSAMAAGSSDSVAMSINAPLAATEIALEMSAIRTGSAGSVRPMITVYYRLIVT